MSNPLISLRLPDDLLRDLDHEAALAGTERAEYMRQIIATAVHAAAVTRLARRVPEPAICPSRWPPQPGSRGPNMIGG